MRLIEAIYLAIPVRKDHRIIRNTPANVWVSKHACLEELKAWNSEYPGEISDRQDKSEPKARVVMFLHLNSLGRSDLANYISKNRKTRSTFGNVKRNAETKLKEKDQKKIGNSKHKSNRKGPDHRPHMKRLTHGVQHRRSNQYDIHRPMIAAVAGGPLSNEGPAAPGKSLSGRWNQAISKNSLFLLIALILVVVFICVIIYLIIRRSLVNSMCCGKRSDSHLGNNSTKEKGLQCVCLDDDQDCFAVFETQSNLASQISEIDVEGGSSIDSVDFDNRKSYSDTMLGHETEVGRRFPVENKPALFLASRAQRFSRATEISSPTVIVLRWNNFLKGHGITTSRVSVERLNLLNDDPAIDMVREAQPLSSCRCRPLGPNVGGSTKPKRKKKKSKAKSKEETKTAKSYLKAVQNKILPRQGRQVKKDCTFDMKQFQEKILAVLNQECGVCQCCNCTLRLEPDGSKFNERRAKHDKQEHKEKHKGEKLSKAKEGVGSEVLSYQASVVCRSPMSAKRSTRKQESDSGRKCGIKDADRVAGKCASSKMRKGKHREVIVSSSSSEIGVYEYCSGSKDGEKRRKSKSKRSYD